MPRFVHGGNRGWHCPAKAAQIERQRTVHSLLHQLIWDARLLLFLLLRLPAPMLLLLTPFAVLVSFAAMLLASMV
jgi:hypothetical protein